jgi:predicted Zn-dependent peptidase
VCSAAIGTLGEPESTASVNDCHSLSIHWNFMPSLQSRQLTCGATLVVEPIANVQSAAMNWLLPLGSAADPPEGDGRAALLSELIFRGAGEMDARQHSDALDRLGVQRSTDVLPHHLRFTATVIGEKLPDALPLLTPMIREPAMRDESLEPVRKLCLQSLDSLADDPSYLVMLQLREQHVPPPLNRHGYGSRDALVRTAIDELRQHWSERCVPQGTIISTAGAVDADALARQLDDLLAGWNGSADEPKPMAKPPRGYRHVPQETAQVHLAIGCDAPAEPEETSMLERVATHVLSGSTSARLFTEVRQKRSLCYSVHASYRANRDRGMIALYAGTTPERAQETLDVCIAELRRLGEGVQRDEFERAVTGLKSHLVMSGESTNARAAALASDQFRLNRPRTLDEVAAAIDAVTFEALNEYLADRLIHEFTIVSIGPNELLEEGRKVERHEGMKA